MFVPIFYFIKNHPPAPRFLLFAKNHARLTCSVVNAFTTARCRYQLFAGWCYGHLPVSFCQRFPVRVFIWKLGFLFLKFHYEHRHQRRAAAPKSHTSLCGVCFLLRLRRNRHLFCHTNPPGWVWTQFTFGLFFIE